jgi:hypothetical protein
MHATLCPSCRSPLSRLADGRLACRACRKAFRSAPAPKQAPPPLPTNPFDFQPPSVQPLPPEDEIHDPGDVEVVLPPWRPRRKDDDDDEEGPPSRATVRIIGWTVCLLVAGYVLVAACMLVVTAYSSRRSPPLKTGAAELAAAYERDTVAADEKFKGRRLEVSGFVASPAEAFAGDYRVFFDRPADARRVVEARFDATTAHRFKGLKKGDRLTVRGACDGIWFGDRIVLKGCERAD